MSNKPYKFSKLKDDAVRVVNGYFGNRFNESNYQAILTSILASRMEGSGLNWRDNHEELKALVIKCIDSWDVRNVKSLIERFPSIVNKAHVNAPIECYMDDNSVWIVSIG